MPGNWVSGFLRLAWIIFTMELELGPSFCQYSAVPTTHSHSHFVRAATGPFPKVGNDSLKRAETMIPIQVPSAYFY